MSNIKNIKYGINTKNQENCSAPERHNKFNTHVQNRI